MGNLEKPLTWVLGIAFVGYLFIANCECSEETTCPLNNGFNISNTDLNVDPLKITNSIEKVFPSINGDVLKIDAPETVEEDGEMVDSVSIEYMEILQGSNDSLDMMEQAEETEEE
mgnify:CR=1 FL=1